MPNYNITQPEYKFSSYTGADIVATMNLPAISGYPIKPIVLGSLSDITISTHKPKYEVLALGYNRPRGFTSGPRVVAGQLVFVMFDTHLVQDISAYYKSLVSNSKDDAVSAIINMADSHEDELPLFDIIINYANDDGYMSHMVLYGIQLMDSQTSVGINIPMTDIVYTYVAIDYKPITRGLFVSGNADNSNAQTDAGTKTQLITIPANPDYTQPSSPNINPYTPEVA